MKVSSLAQDQHDRLAGRVTHVPRVICHTGPETRYRPQPAGISSVGARPVDSAERRDSPSYPARVQLPAYLWPVLGGDAVVDRVPDVAVSQNAVVPEGSFLRCAESLDVPGRPSPRPSLNS